MEGAEADGERGRWRKRWTEDVNRWTRLDDDVPELLTVVVDRPKWRRLSSTASLMPPLTTFQWVKALR